MHGEWMCELCEDGDEILKETGVSAEWMEDSGREFILPGELKRSQQECLSNY